MAGCFQDGFSNAVRPLGGIDMRFILAFLLLCFALPAQAQGGEVWTRSGDRLVLNAARISFPAQAGTLSVTETKEFSHPGESLDAVAQYRSPDEEVFGTVYVYYPGIAHSGLAALATDEAIRLNSRQPVTVHGSRVISAGGREGIAIRSEYGGYLGRLASSAAFIKAGRWMVKLRVSGPEARKTEVASAISALLEQVRFEGQAGPRAASLISTPACPSAKARNAKLLPDDGATIAANAIMIGTADAAGREAVEDGRPVILPSRIGTKWCRVTVKVGDTHVPVIRATDPEAGNDAIEGKSLLFALYSDAGGALEVMRVSNSGKYLLINHQIGATNLLGTFDALPSDRQIAEILDKATDAGRLRARVLLKANGNTEVELQVAPAVESTTT
jgi:hypothetical protein